MLERATFPMDTILPKALGNQRRSMAQQTDAANLFASPEKAAQNTPKPPETAEKEEA